MSRDRSRNRRVVQAVLVLLVAAAWPLTVQAQVGFDTDRELLDVGLQQSYRSWTIETEATGEKRTVRQYSARLLSTFDVHENVDLVFYTAGGFSQDRSATVSEIAGLADTKLKAYGYLWENQLVLSAGLNLPTGRTGLDEEEVRAVQAISPNVFGFRMKRYGEGFDVDLSAALGFELGRDWAVGGGVSYLVKGEYDLDTQTRYAPGDEAAVTVGADWRGGDWLVTGDVLYRMYGDDSFSDQGTFSDGNQLELGLGILWRTRTWGMDLAVRDVMKDDGEFAGSPAGSDTRVDNGNNLWVTWSPSYAFTDELALRALVEYVAVDEAQQQAVGAWTIAYGLGLDVRLAPATLLELRVTALDGGSEDDAVDLSGFDGVINLCWRY